MKNIFFPQAFCEKYEKILPKEDFEKFLKYSKKPLRKSIRVNTLKISVNDFKKIAQDKKWELTPIPWCDEGFWIDREDRTKPLGKSIEHILGLFFIQESSSMMPPSILGSGQKILDMCSAPGSKATQLAGLMQNQGILVANDASASRIKKLTFNNLRCGVKNCIVTNKSGEKFASDTPEYFDKILIDAPCTGEGTIRKDNDALKHWHDNESKKISAIQKSLIKSGFLALQEEGEMVYSTCTLAPEENEEVVKYLLDEFPQAELMELKYSFDGAEKCSALQKYGSEISQKCLRIWPHVFDSEGFFVAKIRKKKSIKIDNWTKKSDKLKYISKKDYKILEKYFIDEFGIDLYPYKNCLFVHRDKKTIFMIPKNFNLSFEFDRAGFSLAEIHRDTVRLDFEGAYLLGDQFTKNTQDLNLEQTKNYLKGQDLENTLKIKGSQVVFKYKNLAIGNAKIMGSRLKNLIPRKFIVDF